MLDFSRIPENCVVQCRTLVDALDFVLSYKIEYPDRAAPNNNKMVVCAFEKYGENLCLNPTFQVYKGGRFELTYGDVDYYERQEKDIIQYDELIGYDDTGYNVDLCELEELLG